MFRPKGLFADITCPYNQECVLPSCLFAHPEDDGGIPPVPGGLCGSTTAVGEEPVGLLEDGGPRKRRKLDDATAPPAITPKHETTILKKIDAPIATSNTLLSSSKPFVSSQKRAAVSPPPTKRRSTLKVDENGQPKAKSSIATPTSKPLKSESLNPRLLATSKTPHNIRLKLAQLLHEQLVRLNTELSKDVSDSEMPLVLSPQALITMALDIEERAGLEKPAVHSNVVKNIVMKYRKMSVADFKKERQIELDRTRAKAEAADTTKRPPKEIKPIETGLPHDLEIAILSKLYTPTSGLSEHGYVNSPPSADEVTKAKSGLSAAQGWEICDRCRVRFQVFPGRREDGALCSGGPCTYHWGKPFFPQKDASDVRGTKKEKRYRCCGEALGDSAGCTTAQTHVFKVTAPTRLATILNFIETPENDKADEDRPICIDGEMGYTTLGLELIRLTATSWPSGEPVLDVLVRPFGEVLDLNSRWSGVLPSHLTGAPLLEKDPKTKDYDPSQLAGTKKLFVVDSPKVARDLLLRILTPRTPLIGHGLENDCNAVRIIHSTIIDTALLFPHSHGLPYRNALRTLVFLHLGRTIQAGGGVLGSGGNASGDSIAAGHDSKEDARSAGDLVLFAVKREWERMTAIGWKLEDGRLVPPKRLSKDDKEMNRVKIDALKEVAGGKRKVAEIEEDAEVIVEE